MRATSDGNRVQLLLDGNEYFGALHRLLDDVERARDANRSYVKLAFWKANVAVVLGRSRTSLITKLQRVANAGKRVRVILWQPDTVSGFAWSAHWHTSNEFLRQVGSVANAETYFEKYLGWPFGRFLSATSQHQKIVIACVDGEKRALVGGLNMEPQYDDTADHGGDYPIQHLQGVPADEQKHNWHDTGLAVEGPAAGDIESEWDRRWAKSKRAPVRLTTVARRGGNTRLTVATTNAESWTSREEHIRQKLVEEIGRANHFVYLESFVVFDPEIVKAIVARLKQRQHLGVLIVVPRPDLQHPAGEAANDYLNFTTFAQLAYASCRRINGTTALGPRSERAIAASGSWNESTSATVNGRKLQLASITAFEGGVRLYSAMRRTAAGAVPIYIHSKLAVIDDHVAVVGSANWNYRSMHYDGELSVFVHDDPAAVREIRRRVFAHFGMVRAATATVGNVCREWQQAAKDADDPRDVAPNEVFMRRLQLADFPQQLPGSRLDSWKNH
ncbi:MAG TPA: phosphatidylserine/phosphatidylglycerophosphate/cardiolipin synthase family protein [Polyangia bacterium]|nr:phosphatidylserine/phosphatidylglycerophosphate/cardiolipin synthase family protein [Polyangia bacterium]